MNKSVRHIQWAIAATALWTATVPALAQDIVIDSGSDETVISRLAEAGIEEQLVCSDSTDGTLGKCSAAILGGPLKPFALSCFERPDMVGASNTCQTDAVPEGYTFVVEHLSGVFVTGEDQAVRGIEVTASGNQKVYLPVHFVGDTLNFGDPLGVGQHNQFGTPAVMYIPGGEMMRVRGDANNAWDISLYAIGRLVPTAEEE